MNKNSIIGFILIAAIMIGYTYWMSPTEEEVARQQFIADSIAQENQRKAIELEKQTKQFEQAAQEQKLESIETPDSSQIQNELTSKYDKFAVSATGIEKLSVIENDFIKIIISNKGGYIKTVELKEYQTFDSLPVVLLDPETSQMGLSFFSNNRIINTKDLYFIPDNNSQHITVTGENTINYSMKLYTGSNNIINKNSYIEFLYTVRGDEYMFDFTINLIGTEGFIAANSSYMDLNWYADLRKQEKTVDRFNGSTIYYKHYQDKDDVEYLSETDDDDEQIATKLKWVSYKQRFFSSAIIAKEGFNNGKLNVFEKENPDSDRYLKSMESNFEIPVNLRGQTSIPLSFYFGPNKFYLLKGYGLNLERQIPIGWSFFLLAWINEYVVIPVFNWLGGYGWNYGIVILLLTIMLKIVLFPIAYKTYSSSAKMRVLKPEIDEISKKFPKQEDAMKKQQAVMALYKKAGANPASGCVPMLLQMPILFAMFRFFPSSIELRQQPFLWATDLSSYDSIATLPFNIPFYGDHVSLFTLLMTVSTIMYTYINNQMMSAQTNQMPGMKTMMYIMPVMFLGIFNSYASGLSYYYFLANIITFIQMFVFRYTINEDKLRTQIEKNKKKPVKKTAFQKRLEEAAKQRGYNPKKR